MKKLSKTKTKVNKKAQILKCNTSESLKKHVVLSKYYNESDHDDEEDAKQAKDFRGIEGWDRVDHLASALLKPERL